MQTKVIQIGLLAYEKSDLLMAVSPDLPGLILHGRYVCKARRPECWHCAIEPLCEFRPKTPPPDL